jgi:hypothetical protein
MLGRVNFEQFLNKNRMLFSECCFLRYLQNNDYDLKKKIFEFSTITLCASNSKKINRLQKIIIFTC